MKVTNEQELSAAIAEVDAILDSESETPEDTARLIELSDAIKEYEDVAYPFNDSEEA